METKNEMFIKEPTRNLPLTGIPISGIRNYAELKSRNSSERDLLNFIDSCLNAKKVYGCVIKAWWGEGKTDIYENFIKPTLENKGILVFYVLASTIARVLERNEKENISSRVIWVAFLASLFEAIWEENRLITDLNFLERKEDEKTSKKEFNYIERIINQLIKKGEKIFIFIDELEQLEQMKVRDDIFLGIRGLFDQNEKILQGNLHLILACTPDAFNRFSNIYTQMGGLLERLTIIELPHPSKEESIEFIYGLINYIYENEIPEKHPFLSSGVAYAIAYASHYSPRAMIKILQNIIEHAKRKAMESGYKNSLKRIDGFMIIEALRNRSIQIFGTQIPALDDSYLLKIIESLKVSNDELKSKNIEKLFYLLIGEPIPFSISELSDRLKIRERGIKEYIGIIINKGNEIQIIEGPFLLQLGLCEKHESEIPRELKKYLLTYLIYENNKVVTKNFFPFDKESFKVLFPEEKENSFHKFQFKVHRYLKDEKYYLISHKLLDYLYPSPEFLQLKFIRDRNKRLELWKKAYEALNDEKNIIECEKIVEDLIKRTLGV
jgi:hypothetical protein